MMPAVWLVRLGIVALLATSACGLTEAKSPLAGQKRLPPFPDPAPAAAATMRLPTGLVAQAGDEDLSEPHERLAAALSTAGFDKWTVYAYRDGFAIVARWEHIEESGRPAADRFPTRHPVRIRRSFDLDEHAQLLFNAPPGDYRLFVFTVAGNDPALSADVPIDGDEVEAGELPIELAERGGSNRVAEVRVYLFAREGDEKARIAATALDARAHLTSAGIFAPAELR